MQSKNKEIDDFANFFKKYLHQYISENNSYNTVSLQLDKSLYEVKDYGNPKIHGNYLNAHEIPFLSWGYVILNFLMNKWFANFLEKQTNEIPKHISDQWIDLIKFCFELKEGFYKGEKYSFMLEDSFSRKSKKLFNEWKRISDK